LIYLKYLKAKITYEHDKRVETYPFAREAIREAVYNAIAHNCYMFGTPIQIRIEDEAVIISNRCILPEGWTIETLMEPHDSIPYNPDIANVFYRAGYIETWGRGIQKICDACRELGTDMPQYELQGNGIRVHFIALKNALIEDLKVLKVQCEPLGNLLENKILEEIRKKPRVTYDELVIDLAVSRSSVKRAMRNLVANGRIERIGGKRYGHWQILG